MRLEIAERMRCPGAHAPMPLIVVARRRVGRELIEGFAGCPVCHLEARVRGGDVYFPGAVPPADAPHASPVDDAARDRLLAQLALAQDGGAILLTGRYVALAGAICRALDVAAICLGRGTGDADGASAVHLAGRQVPFTDGAFRGAALDAPLDASTAHDVARTVMVGGRIVGAQPLAVPTLAQPLAQDAREWVAERTAESGAVIPLRRA